MNLDTLEATTCQVFVYGTLKRAYHRFSSLDGAIQKGTAWIKGFAMRSLGAFPTIYPEDMSTVFGEIYEITPETLKRLDGIEGVASGFYQRAEIDVPYHGKCWVYVQDSPRPGQEILKVIDGYWKGDNTNLLREVYLGKTVALLPGPRHDATYPNYQPNKSNVEEAEIVELDDDIIGYLGYGSEPAEELTHVREADKPL